jgi:hypothetical protein
MSNDTLCPTIIGESPINPDSSLSTILDGGDFSNGILFGTQTGGFQIQHGKNGLFQQKLIQRTGGGFGSGRLRKRQIAKK